MPFDLDIRESLFFKQAAAIVTKEAEAVGESRGETVGMARILTMLLEHRFGPLPEPVRQVIANASKSQLERWAIRATDAHSVEDVFAGKA